MIAHHLLVVVVILGLLVLPPWMGKTGQIEIGIPTTAVGLQSILDPKEMQGVPSASVFSSLAPTIPGDEFWVPGFGSAGLWDYIEALAKDAQGNLYAAYSNSCWPWCGVTTYVAKWDGTAWYHLHNGLQPAPTVSLEGGFIDLAVDAQGTVYAAVRSEYPWPTGQYLVMRWDGTAWHSLDMGSNSEVGILATGPNGDLYAAGQFSTAGGVPANGIARWDGTAWHPLGDGISGPVQTLAFGSDGSLYAGGSFTLAGGEPANGIARWDGTSWHAIGLGQIQPISISALTITASGTVYAGGSFSTPVGWSNRVARWDGTDWSYLGNHFSGGVWSLAIDENESLFAGGNFGDIDGVLVNYIARWNGSQWLPVDDGMRMTSYCWGCDIGVHDLVTDDWGYLYAGGVFTRAGDVYASGVARWNGNAWSGVGGEGTGPVYALEADPIGNVYAGGSFFATGDTLANNIARWDNAAWHPLGSGTNGDVNAIEISPDGSVYVGGRFTVAGDVPANYIAKWGGNTWSPLSDGVSGDPPTVNTLVADAAGNLYVGGWFTTAGGISANNVARWDGNSWSPLDSGINGTIRTLAIDMHGSLYAGGDFSTVGGAPANGVARWDGTAWHSLGDGIIGRVAALVFGPDGSLYAGGDFTSAGGIPANGIARWDGASWHAVGSGVGFIQALVATDNGDIYAGGYPSSGISHWDGVNWHSLGQGTNERVNALKITPDSMLYVGGNFYVAGGIPSSGFGIWTGATNQARRPVILVHGWQGMNTNPQLWRTCSAGVELYNPYIPTHSQWGTIASGLRSAGFSVYIANLNSRPFSTPPLEWNAACLRDQVEEVVQQHQGKVILIGHSMGGLVSRAYLEDDTLYRDKVVQVLTLGSPHGGVNYNPTLLSPGLCIHDPAACQFTQAGMRLFNWTHNNRAQGVTYNLMGGNWGGGRSRRILITDGPNDSVVGLASATGRYWPEDLGVAVAGVDGRYQTIAMHSGEHSYMHDPATLSCIKHQLGLNGSCTDATVEHSAVTDVPLLSQQTGRINGQLSSAQAVSTTLAIDTDGASLFVLDWIGSSLILTLTSPSGISITPTYAAANPSIVNYATEDATSETPAWAGYWFTDTVPGPWTLWVQSTAMPPAISTYAASAWLETARTLSAGANSDLYHVGDTAVMTASLSTGGIGITGANVVAELQLGNGMTNTVTLSHEGSGNYAASYVIPDVPGYVFGQVKASGNDGGTPFSRRADLMFAIASEAVQLNGNYSERTPDDNGDGRYDALLIDVGIDATRLVTLSLRANLASPGITTTLTSITTTVVPTGSHVLTLQFPGRSIHRARASGPYTVTDVLLQDFSLGGVVAQTGSNVYTTQLYDYRQFGLMGDVDSSCVVDVADLIAIASAWNSSNFNPDLDLDFDNQITIADVMLAAGNWEASCWE